MTNHSTSRHDDYAPSGSAAPAPKIKKAKHTRLNPSTSAPATHFASDVEFEAYESDSDASE